MDVMKIGAFIKSQRTEMNLTQKELAEKIGCTDKAVSRWETGKGLPDIFFVIPNFIPNSLEPFEIMLALSAVVSVFAGFIKNKFKWLFPVAISLIFFLINLFYRTEEGFLGFVLSLYFAAGSAIIIAVSSLIAFIYRKIKN